MMIRRDDLLRRLRVTDVQLDKLRTFEEMLRRWSRVKNLVSGQDLDDIWDRHILDSAQVQRALPDANLWMDLGSGGGFPGLVTAIFLADRPGAVVHLVESDNRKCAFLRSVSRETGIPAEVHHGRIEAIVPSLPAVDAVSARALASMDVLIAWAGPVILDGAIGVFPKGRSVQNELTRLATDSRFQIEIRPSLSQPDGSLVIVRRTSPMEQTGETS